VVVKGLAQQKQVEDLTPLPPQGCGGVLGRQLQLGVQEAHVEALTWYVFDIAISSDSFLR
jgi:hypothetical protein